MRYYEKEYQAPEAKPTQGDLKEPIDITKRRNSKRPLGSMIMWKPECYVEC